MRYKTLALSLGVIASMSASTSSYAFKTQPQDKHDTQHIRLVSNEALEVSAKTFVSNLAEQGIGFLENQDLSKEKREKEFRKLLKNNFDMKTIARFALGRYWKVSTKEERKEYLALFENMIVEVYSRRFSEYNGQKLDITSARPEGKRDALVSSKIVPQQGPEIDVDWRVRKKKDGSLKIIDIMVEGVSMSLTQRSDFASVIQRGGGKVDVLLAHLRETE